MGKLEIDYYLRWTNKTTMPVHKLNSQHVQSVNYLMHEINTLTDDIYEALMDRDDDAAIYSLEELAAKIVDVLETLDDGKKNY